jgi:integrase
MAKAKKLPSGNWRVQASKSINGRMIKKSFTAASKKEAEFLAAEWQMEIKEENSVQNITLRQAYLKYIEMKNAILSPSTIRGYEAMLRNTFLEIMDSPILKITQSMIQIEVNKLSANSSPKYVRNAYGLLNAVLKVFRTDLNLNISLPQKNKPELYIPDDNDIKTLLNIVKGEEIEIPILLAAFGPMRRGEICALTSDDVCGNVITVNKSLVKTPQNTWVLKAPKTYSSYRQIEYPDFVIERLKGINGNLTTMTPNAITDAFQKILKTNNLHSFRFHDLRHYAVSTLHAINVPDKYIMARGGWATNYTMNNVYNHTLKSKRDELSERITSHFNAVYDN